MFFFTAEGSDYEGLASDPDDDDMDDADYYEQEVGKKPDKGERLLYDPLNGFFEDTNEVQYSCLRTQAITSDPHSLYSVLGDEGVFLLQFAR